MTKNAPRRNGLLTILIGPMVAALLAGGGWLVLFARDVVTKSDLIREVERETSEIHARVEDNRDKIDRLRGVVDGMTKAQQELLIEQRVLIEKIDNLIKKER